MSVASEMSNPGVVYRDILPHRGPWAALRIARAEKERAEQVFEASVAAGQLAVGEYATPHTRQSAEIGANVANAWIVEGMLSVPPSVDDLSLLQDTVIRAARDELGQYYAPHARQSAQAAAREMLTQHGYLEQNQSRGEQ